MTKNFLESLIYIYISSEINYTKRNYHLHVLKRSHSVIKSEGFEKLILYLVLTVELNMYVYVCVCMHMFTHM